MNWQEKVISRVAGELENFSKDAIEYYQKTGMAYPPELHITAKRIFALAEVDEAEQRGIRKVVEWLNKENTLKLKSLQGTPDWFRHCGLLITDEKWQAFLKGAIKPVKEGKDDTTRSY